MSGKEEPPLPSSCAALVLGGASSFLEKSGMGGGSQPGNFPAAIRSSMTMNATPRITPVEASMTLWVRVNFNPLSGMVSPLKSSVDVDVIVIFAARTLSSSCQLDLYHPKICRASSSVCYVARLSLHVSFEETPRPA